MEFRCFCVVLFFTRRQDLISVVSGSERVDLSYVCIWKEICILFWINITVKLTCGGGKGGEGKLQDGGVCEKENEERT